MNRFVKEFYSTNAVLSMPENSNVDFILIEYLKCASDHAAYHAGYSLMLYSFFGGGKTENRGGSGLKGSQSIESFIYAAFYFISNVIATLLEWLTKIESTLNPGSVGGHAVFAKTLVDESGLK